MSASRVGAASGSLGEEHALSGWITLNVGGTIFRTSRATLLSAGSTHMLARLVSAGLESTRDENGAILLDRDPRYFAPVLNYLRHGRVFVDPGLSIAAVREEADYFGLDDLVELLSPARQPDFDSRAALLCAVAATDRDLTGVRLFGLDLTSLSLAKLVLANAQLDGVDCTNAILDDAVLAGASVCGTRFCAAGLKRADLRTVSGMGARFDAACLADANLSSADLSGASFASADCTRALFQCAALAGVDFSKADLTQAKFQSADLRKCDLRTAVLTHARFKSADLRGAQINWASWDLTCCLFALVTEAEYAAIPLDNEAKASMRLVVVDELYTHVSTPGGDSMGAQVGVRFHVAGTVGSGLRLRAEPASETTHLIVPEGALVVSRGAVVRTRAFYWYQVEYDGREGWLASMYLRRAPDQPALVNHANIAAPPIGPAGARDE